MKKKKKKENALWVIQHQGQMFRASWDFSWRLFRQRESREQKHQVSTRQGEPEWLDENSPEVV